MLIPFAEWRPDVAGLNSAFTEDVMNVLCANGFYMPFKAPVPLGTALSVDPTGAFTARSSDGSIFIFAGSAEKLWLMDNTDRSWTDVSKSATTYHSTDEERWMFAQFGDYVVAVNANDNPQVFNLISGTAFDDLGGSPPKARLVAACGDFLFLGNLTDHPSRVQWSALNDITGWTPGTNNSDYQEFPDGGPVAGITSATNPIIIQRSAIRFATFVPGSTEIFTFQKVHDGRGSPARYSVCSRGNVAFYADNGGFFQVGADGALTPIGFEKVDRTVFDQVTHSDVGAIAGVIDPFYSRVYWLARYGGSAGFNRMLIYDWNLQRWSQAQFDVDAIIPLAAAAIGYTLDNLDDVSASLDALPFSLDSRVWMGGAPIMAAFDADRKLSFFSGAPSEAALTTQEMGDTAGGVTRITETTPVLDTLNFAVSFGARFRRGDDPVWSAEAAPSSNTGVVRKNSRSRFHRIKVRVPAGEEWTRAQGVDVKTAPAGLR